MLTFIVQNVKLSENIGAKIETQSSYTELSVLAMAIWGWTAKQFNTIFRGWEINEHFFYG